MYTPLKMFSAVCSAVTLQLSFESRRRWRNLKILGLLSGRNKQAPFFLSVGLFVLDSTELHFYSQESHRDARCGRSHCLRVSEAEIHLLTSRLVGRPARRRRWSDTIDWILMSMQRVHWRHIVSIALLAMFCKAGVRLGFLKSRSLAYTPKKRKSMPYKEGNLDWAHKFLNTGSQSFSVLPPLNPSMS